MTNQTFNRTEYDTENLLKEFNEIANKLSPPSGLFSSLKQVMRTWMCLNLTSLIQATGYNKRRINQWESQNGKIIINLGSLGSYGNPDYLRADLLLGVRDLPKVFSHQLGYELVMNVTACDHHLINSVDGIFLSHVLEHIPPNLALEALKNCFAYLKKDGCLRIIVPDIAKIKLEPTDDLANNIRNTLGINRSFYDWGHKFMYNSDLLIVLLKQAGFSEITEVDFREGLLGETDLHKYKDGSIYITAIKDN
ncbi:hypothetical protein [Crocosphaera sp.]|uniref:hypothetical protein n=1 Tax=Crocosphaera sp. TaxID=2729996 RepID=UPI003F247C1F|nr:hypothetical protein [Crocosphaera sp.]